MKAARATGGSARILSASGMHLDHWCEPRASVKMRSDRAVEVATAVVWIMPNSAYPDAARWAVQVDRQEPFVCEIEQDRPTYVGFSVGRDRNCTFELDFICDYVVTNSAADKRNLSFVLSELIMSADDAPPVGAESSESPSFGAFAWSDDATFRGRLAGVPLDTVVEAFLDGEKITDARTDSFGNFELELATRVSGHSPRTVNLVAGEFTKEVDVVLDPVAIGADRTDTELPRRKPREASAGADAAIISEAVPAPVPYSPPASAPALPAHSPPQLENVFAPLLDTMAVQTAALRALLARPTVAAASDHRPLPGPMDLAERYGPLFPMAANRAPHHDIIFLGVIDWDYRVQRPQHIAADLARRGNRVFYISIVFASADFRGRFQILQSPETGVYEIRLKLGCPLPPNIYRKFDEETVLEILAALDEMAAVLSVRAPVVVVEYPSWAPVAFGLPGATVVHDCLDLVSGFEGTPDEVVELEEELVASADLVVTTSAPLRDILAEQRDVAVIRNGADVELFAEAAERPEESPYDGKVIGYFGAIAEWFNAEWILNAAEAHPDWTIVLIGEAHEDHLREFTKHKNIVLLGELPYSELVEHLAYFDVAVIPFKLVDLILCTNPVKLYEYMAAGKPVVASSMPEVRAATDLVYVAEDGEDFVAQIERAIEEDSPDLRAARMAWAQEHSWPARGAAFMDLLEADPKVSVVVLSYKNWDFTRATLWSVVTYSDYANLEIIVVDNGSGDEIVRNLKSFADRDPRIKLILSEENLGYAAGNNLGLREATGEYLILLNNDTYVTKGWVKDLIRPLRHDKTVGLVSPLTNNIGNEQRVTINYATMEEMARTSRRIVRQHARERFEADCVAFFCVGLRRDVLEKVGLLDETYGLGFFEDDDYCKRTIEAGYRIQIVDDVFVHHHLSASFDQLGDEKKAELMERNRAIFEERWGPWKAHSYRRAAGFG